MKIKMGPYKDELSIFSFTNELVRIGISDENADKIGDYLYELSWVKWIFAKYNKLFNVRKIKVHIDKYDTWSMYTTLSVIITPMLRQLKDTKHGYPYVDNEDVPEELHTHNGIYDPDTDDGKMEAKWDYVLDEMIFAFDAVSRSDDEDWQHKYWSGVCDIRSKEVMIDGEPHFEAFEGPNHTYTCDTVGLKKEQERLNNGFRLFGKYFQSLWD